MGKTETEPFPRGHFYSPLPDIDYLGKRIDSVFDTTITDLPGIDLNTERQEEWLDKFLNYGPDFKWTGKKTD